MILSAKWDHTLCLGIGLTLTTRPHWRSPVELLSEDSSTVGSGLCTSFGSSVAATVIMPDLDESGKKAPVRMRCKSKSNCRRGSAKRSLLYISCDFFPVLWCPRICLTSALRPALPAELSAVLFKQWMAVASRSCPRALYKMLSNHFFASRVLVDLLVHCPSSVGAGSSGTWSKSQEACRPVSLLLQILEPREFCQPLQTGATKDMESPCFCTDRAVLWLLVLYSR